MKYLITVTITRDDNAPPIVPGCITHAVGFSDDVANHRVLQLARDAAEATALGFLIKGELPPSPRPAEPTAISPATSKVLDLYYLGSGRPVVVLNLRGKRGDFIASGARRWEIQAIETHAVAQPPLPWGFVVTGDPPKLGDEVWIVAGIDHDSTPWPMGDS